MRANIPANLKFDDFRMKDLCLAFGMVSNRDRRENNHTTLPFKGALGLEDEVAVGGLRARCF
jgi:hypothetical protein